MSNTKPKNFLSSVRKVIILITKKVDGDVRIWVDGKPMKDMEQAKAEMDKIKDKMA